MRLGEQVSVLEKEFRDLATLWERFFSGDIRVPPSQKRIHLQQRLRLLLDNPGVSRRADSFRLEQLQHRFATYSQNWERQLRDREEGRSKFPLNKGYQSPIPAQPNTSPPASVKTDSGESLFDRFKDAKSGLGQNMGMDRETFEKKIAAQRKALEAKMGSAVRFDIRVEDGRVKLTAKKAKKN